jgi:outer membrane protein assembly factor BamA
MIFRGKIESAGNLLSLLSRASKQLNNQESTTKFFEVEYSQYFKVEGEFIKLWDLHRKRILAIRSFAGVAIPYGNSTNIPFSRSYFAGGTNDNRAWQSYGLGPGASGGINDFNEANLKLALSAELRFNLFGQLNGALFIDAGNIWRIQPDINKKDGEFLLNKFADQIAIGAGFGLRWDLTFFVIRLDLAVPLKDPKLLAGDRWTFDKKPLNYSVLNFGIGYPF